MVRELRKSHCQYGLILANGGNLTKHNVVCLSSQPRKDKSPYPTVNPLANRQPEIGLLPLTTEANGEAAIEVTRTPILVRETPTNSKYVDIYCRI
jgi:hypothetical protein